ncbi:S8 family serine peptidase [Candidatus Mycalebacterium sp.]
MYVDGLTAPPGYLRIQDQQSGPRLSVPNPPQDVRDAWRAGWTGAGVNVLIIDSFGGPPYAPTHSHDTRGTHGYTVGLSAREIAPGASFLSLESGTSISGGGTGRNYRDTYIPPESGSGRSPATRIDVINMSFGLDPIGDHASDDQVERYKITGMRPDLYADLTAGLSGGTAFLTNTGDAVITKAAGNEGGVDASRYVDNVALILDPHTGPRALIVGALDNYARPAATTNLNAAKTRNRAGEKITTHLAPPPPPGEGNVSPNASIASYSAVAGSRTNMQNRFLVEYGGTPYSDSAYLCANDDTPATCDNPRFVYDEFSEGVGTSFSAPRVAGHAALVRHKFPGLTGAQTAKILLDTATTEGIFCHPSCNVETYGQGRVSIGDALSPIGKLR